MTGMDKIVAFDQSQSFDDFVPLPLVEQRGNATREQSGNIPGQHPQKI